MNHSLVTTDRTLGFGDGRFRFRTAAYGSWAGDARIVFRVRADRDPQERAAEKGIRHFDALRISTRREIGRWLISHPDFPIA